MKNKYIDDIIDNERMNDIEYIKYLEHCIINISGRLNTFVYKCDNDLEYNDGKKIKEIYLEYLGILTTYK